MSHVPTCLNIMTFHVLGGKIKSKQVTLMQWNSYIFGTFIVCLIKTGITTCTLLYFNLYSTSTSTRLLSSSTGYQITSQPLSMVVIVRLSDWLTNMIFHGVLQIITKTTFSCKHLVYALLLLTFLTTGKRWRWWRGGHISSTRPPAPCVFL